MNEFQFARMSHTNAHKHIDPLRIHTPTQSTGQADVEAPLFSSPGQNTPAPDDGQPQVLNQERRWEVLVVDEDESVLRSTELALRGFQVEDRTVAIHRATSASAAQTFLMEHGPVSVVVADVVMESEDADLTLISWIRADQRFDAMRLVIRTGHAALAPEETVLKHLDINDYWPKAAITAHRMRTILTGLIRSHRDIELVRKQKATLAKIPTRLFEQKQFKTLSELSKGIAHDINNALTPITAYASMLVELPNLPASERIEYAETILQASLDAAEVVRRLKGEYGLDRVLSPTASTNLRLLLTDSLSLARPRLAQRETNDELRISLSVHADPTLTVIGNASELRQALLNIIFNAIDAMTDDGLITLTAISQEQHMVIEVQDNGPGMSHAILHQCQKAYFTTKGGGGTGLGLAMVAQTCTDHDGQLEITSELNVGTLVSIILPHRGLER